MPRLSVCTTQDERPFLSLRQNFHLVGTSLLGYFDNPQSSSFEHFLRDESITINDLDAEYAAELITATIESRPVAFESYRSLDRFNETPTIPPKILFVWFKDLYSSHLAASDIPHVGSACTTGSTLLPAL